MASAIVRGLGRVCSKCRITSLQTPVYTLTQYRHFSGSLSVLAGRLYTEKHEWIKVDNGVGVVGISDYAQNALSEVVYVQLPETGHDLEANGEAGCLESVKAASEIYSPVSGTISDINQLLADTPNLINDSPYEKGWLFKIRLSKPDELKILMDEAAYKSFTESLE